MNGVLLLAIGIAIVSIWGAAYLLSVWHDDRADLLRRGHEVSTFRTWPFSRVLAYVSIACMLSSTYLGTLTVLRLIGLPEQEEIRVALTPFTLAALLVLDVAFVIIAAYLRFLRGRLP